MTMEKHETEIHTSSQIKGIDYVELYVSNSLQAAYFYETAFGFKRVAYVGLETGVQDRTSFMVEQGKIRLVLTSPLHSDTPIADSVKAHGDCVQNIAFTVDNAVHAFEEAVKYGARSIMEPRVFEDQEKRSIQARVGVYGDTMHSFVQHDTSDYALLPECRAIQSPQPPSLANFSIVDHIAITVEQDEVDRWTNFYHQAFDFHELFQQEVSTDYSAMKSKAIQNQVGSVKFVLMEPAAGKRKSQIEEYLMFNGGPGVQHLGMLSNDIVKATRDLSARGIQFLHTPPTYYDVLEGRIGEIDEDIAALRELNILADRDEWGYLLQIFTKPLQARPTFFIEIIQRRNARGFGGGNVKALFEAIEREQVLRGNL